MGGGRLLIVRGASAQLYTTLMDLLVEPLLIWD